MAKTDAVCTQCGGTNTYEKTDPIKIAECVGEAWECRDCEESYTPDGPSEEGLLNALQSVADCEVCGGCQDMAMGVLKGQERVSVGEALSALHDMVWHSNPDQPSTKLHREKALKKARVVLKRAAEAGMI